MGTDQVFDVVGEVFPAKLLEKLLREMYARQTDEHKIQDRIVRDVSPERFRAITESALEGLAKRGRAAISRRPHLEDPKTLVEVRFIEVKVVTVEHY